MLLELRRIDQDGFKERVYTCGTGYVILYSVSAISHLYQRGLKQSVIGELNVAARRCKFLKTKSRRVQKVLIGSKKGRTITPSITSPVGLSTETSSLGHFDKEAYTAATVDTHQFRFRECAPIHEHEMAPVTAALVHLICSMGFTISYI